MRNLPTPPRPASGSKQPARSEAERGSILIGIMITMMLLMIMMAAMSEFVVSEDRAIEQDLAAMRLEHWRHGLYQYVRTRLAFEETSTLDSDRLDSAYTYLTELNKSAISDDERAQTINEDGTARSLDITLRYPEYNPANYLVTLHLELSDYNATEDNGQLTLKSSARAPVWNGSAADVVPVLENQQGSIIGQQIDFDAAILNIFENPSL